MKKDDEFELSLDMRLAEIYHAAAHDGEDALELICPEFLELRNDAQRYEDKDLLGCGGLKEVFRTYDHRTQRDVARARLRTDRGLQYYDLFIREARLVASLSHPNIIKVYDVGVDDAGRPYFTMALKGNTNLADLIRAESPPDRAELLGIFLKVCDAMAYAHAKGVIHLDLKPENIQCDCFGQVMVCDWGLGMFSGASAHGADSEILAMPSVENQTMLGQVKGSLGYMAPEQAGAGMQKDERTDIFALGCILHTLLCGEPPFTGARDDVLYATEHEAVASLRTRYPEQNIPSGLEAVVLKATAPVPEDRYPSVGALQKDIQKYLGGFAPLAEQPGFFKEARLFLARNRVASTVAAVALVGLTVLSVLFVQRLGQQRLATLEERARANRLLSKVSVLSSDYKELSEQSALSKKELAQQLADSTYLLRASGLFIRPVSTEAQMRKLLNMALDLDPDCRAARRARFELNCLVLNYEEALRDRELLSSRSGMNPDVKKLAEAFSHYNFGADSRPSNEQVVALIRKAEQLGCHFTMSLERMFAYHAAGNTQAGFDEAVATFMAYYNGGADHFKMSYEYQGDVMRIRSDRNSLVLKIQSPASDGCFARYLPVRSLIVSTSGSLNLTDLNHLKTLEELDISDCEQVVLGKIRLYELRKVTVRRDQFDLDLLRANIKTKVPVKIVEK